MLDLRSFKNRLLKQQEDLETKLNVISVEEAFLSEEVIGGNDVATFSWNADVRHTKSVLKQRSLTLLKQIESSLQKIDKGIYGHCERCYKEINQDRLKIVPTAKLCEVCI